MKSILMLKDLIQITNGHIKEGLIEVLEEVEAINVEVINLRQANKDFLDTIIAAQQTILNMINK